MQLINLFLESHLHRDNSTIYSRPFSLFGQPLFGGFCGPAEVLLWQLGEKASKDRVCTSPMALIDGGR